MSTSNVRSIDSLELFLSQLVRLSVDWNKTLQEIRALVHRAEAHFGQDLPAYWRRQSQLAERELTEAKDTLAQKRSAARPEDRAPATEAFKRVRHAEQRLRTCESKVRLAKSISIEIGQACDMVLGPLADVTEHCEVVLPEAARQLRTLIEQLRGYAEQSKNPPTP